MGERRSPGTPSARGRWGGMVMLLGSIGGCSYLEQRGRDTLDMVRFQGSVGVGLHAYAHPGELAHLGVGGTAGVRYGLDYVRRQANDEGSEYSLWPGRDSLHAISFCEEHHKQRHRCSVFLPAVTSRGYGKKPLHWFDLEVGGHALLLGVHLGFSLGEFVDWLLGWFGIDIAGDDRPASREARALWRAVEDP